ncbi:hypothetical protein FRX31_004981 [Thalictrum thalictroides]|uniref:Uncharacterized protein n=1 Tax=Thalictrum thalictroides TaxID=46969 RepID=A0A7J6X6W7_THATH|nr:hypothetical protein FRX31_004981 [Thalictrum thalictroides]
MQCLRVYHNFLSCNERVKKIWWFTPSSCFSATPAPGLPIRDHNYGEVVGLLSSANILSFRTTSIIFLLILNFYYLSEL